ncbi:MAG: DUF4091 domain-containing protein [Clostridia bacterium]|nr:DUF4091 domain-containing protein [Clostridia bacterium]
MWFEHSFKKVFTSDKTHSGMDTYSVYMGKNEIQNAQFILYSDTDKTGMKATVSSFTDNAGNTIPAEIYYQMYITTSNLRSDSVRGTTMETSFIREGETPDPMVPLKNIGSFKLNGGKSQAFFIKLKTAESTPSGWYSAQLDIQNSSGQIVKTATVFCYVWDFVIDEKTEFQTAIYFDKNTSYGGSYQANYDYLLENRISGMDIPGGLYAENPYLANPRVSAIRVGVSGGYMDNQFDYSKYADVYSELKSSPYWDEFKDKLYFYTVDEPMGKEQQDAVAAIGGGNSGHTVDDAIIRDRLLDTYWGDMAATCIPYHQNHPYPYYYYNQPLGNYADYEKKDATQEMIDSDSCRVWCPLLTAFTPAEELDPDYTTNFSAHRNVRTITGQISGMYTIPNSSAALGYDYYSGFYDWDGIYGEFYDRTMSDITIKNEKNGTDTYKMWTYLAGCNNQYTYAHHLIESTGIQTKMLFWQCYQNDITGYLFYYANEWNPAVVDTTDTGALTMLEWCPGVGTYEGKYNIFGAGVLFYAPNHAKGIRGLKYVGSVRIEHMRDGIEEYQMLTMLEDYIGEKETKDLVGKVSTNVVRYLSIPGFDRSSFSSNMDDYDVMEAVRREIGNTLEAKAAEGRCDHSFDDGEVILEATCLEMGTLRRTCKDCGITTDDIIPTLHSEGSCYEKVSGIAPTCTTDGAEIFKCTVCGNMKTVSTTAFHSDLNYYTYEQNSAKAHTVYCSVCSEKVDVKEHTFFTIDTATCYEGGFLKDECRFCGYVTDPTDDDGNVVITETPAKDHALVTETVDATCTDDGYTGTVCKNCDFSETTVIPAPGHNYTEGFCIVCGEADPDYSPEPDVMKGDISGDGKINGMDINIAKRILSGTAEPTDEQLVAADVTGDGAFNGLDATLLSRFISGSINDFN